MPKNYSFRKQNKESIKARSRLGVEAHLRNIAERPAPPYPPDGPGFYREITVRDYSGSVLLREEKFFLDSDAGNINQWAVWRDRACIGVMGFWRAFQEICRTFPAMRRM